MIVDCRKGRGCREDGLFTPKHHHDRRWDVTSISVSKIVETPLNFRLLWFHDNASERMRGTMLTPYYVYIELFSQEC